MSKPLRILLIDDSPNDRALSVRQLRREFDPLEVCEVHDEPGFVEALARGGFDAVLTDYHLGWSDGVTVISAVRERWPNCPVIMVTGTGTEETAVAAMKAGLDDYVLKTREHLARLPAALQSALARADIQRQLREQQAEEHRFQQQLVALHEVSNELQHCDTTEDLCRRTVELWQQRLGYDRLGIWLLDEDSGELHGTFGVDEQGNLRDEREWRLAGEDPGNICRVTREGRRLLYAPEAIIFDTDGNEVGHGAHAVASIGDGRRVVGAVSADNLTSGKPFTKADAELLALLTDTLGHLLARLQAHRAMLHERDLLRTLMDHLPDHLYFKDRESRFTRINRTLAKAFGLQDPDEALGKTDADFFTEEHATQALIDEQKVMETGEPLVGVEEKETWPDGRETWVSTTKAPLRDADGNVIGTFGISRDITVHRQLEDQSRLASLGQLAAGIAHDFNNLLMGVVGYSELLLLDAEVPEKAKKKIEGILSQGHRGARLVRQIQDFGRKALARPELLDLAALLEDHCDSLKETLQGEVQCDLPAEPAACLVRANADQLRQALTNLAVNAREAGGAGVSLRLRLSRVEIPPGQPGPTPAMGSGPLAKLVITDTGPGMSPEVLSRCFEPFFTTKDVGQGSGLGLAQVYGIVKQCEGDIEVRSQPGQGTEFALYFPLVSGGPSSSAAEQLGPPAEGQGETWILAEDSPLVREFAVEILTELGYHVLAAVNGREALALFEEHADEIDGVLTDLVMPELSGHQLLEHLREAGYTGPVVALTGYPLGEDAALTTMRGFTDWMQKPPSLHELASKLRKALDAHSESPRSGDAADH